MRFGYHIFQVDLNKPDSREFFSNAPVAWTLMRAEGEIVCDFLNEEYSSLYFFITKKP